jgi:tRNA1Val (adenine37-N6)-methyltransferase
MKKSQSSSASFQFQQFTVAQDKCAMKVGTDGILLGAWAPIEEAQHILDIGAGTGLIGLMVAQRTQEGRVVLVEVDPDAAAQATENVQNSPFSDRAEVIKDSIQQYSTTNQAKFDLIVSNPPFFTGGVISEQEGRANVRHTLKLSHGDLLRSVQRLLAPSGSFCVVLPWLEGLRFAELAAGYHLYPHRLAKVSPHPDKSPNRILLQLKQLPADEVQEEIFSIYATAGESAARSTSYQVLTDEFFLK